MNTKEIFELGYAIPLYTTSSERRVWRFREQEFIVPANSVRLHHLPGVNFDVARVEEVRNA